MLCNILCMIFLHVNCNQYSAILPTCDSLSRAPHKPMQTQNWLLSFTCFSTLIVKKCSLNSGKTVLLYKSSYFLVFSDKCPLKKKSPPVTGHCRCGRLFWPNFCFELYGILCELHDKLGFPR